MEKSPLNPIEELYNRHGDNILSVRYSLFSSLDKTSPAIRKGAEDILNKKLRQTNKNGSPLAFELFPWLIKDLIGLSHSKTFTVSVNWVALYLYISFVDDHLDAKGEIKADEFLGASLLAQSGLLNLFKIVHGTKYEALFNKALKSSAKFQLEDVLNQANAETDSFAKAKAAAGKNHILLACAGALAATKESDADFIVKLTNKLLLTIQLLDDLADLESDYKQNNITIALNDVCRSDGSKNTRINREAILKELLIAGSLSRITKRIETSLSASIVLIESQNIKNTNPTFKFFTQLYFEVIELSEKLKQVPSNFALLPPSDQYKIIEKVDKSIMKIYMHT